MGYAWIMRGAHPVVACIVACCAAVLALASCAAGQITQTDSQVPAVDGVFADVGSTIALRNVLIPYPPNPTGSYAAGSAVPVLLAIINQGERPDELIAVTSPVASQVQLQGTTQIPPGTTVFSTSGTRAGAPVSPLVAGELRIVMITNQPLRAGLNTPITFQFRNAGTVTLGVPMGTSSDVAS